MNIGIMFFSCDEYSSAAKKYQLMLDASKYADKNNYIAIWTPERHFSEFGGLYPNPSVTSAALAVATSRIQLRAGSLVSPLHNILRVAEEWAVVDNLSNGRIGISFGSGWNEDDFIFFPENYTNRHEIMYRQIEEFTQLWKGEAIKRIGSSGEEIDLKIWPKPFSNRIPIWISIASNEEAFYNAGKNGFNILTHLVSQSLKDLENKIVSYWKGRIESGLNPKEGIVSLMLHTYVCDGSQDESFVEPLKLYIKKVLKMGGVKSSKSATSKEIIKNNEDIQNEMVEISYNRYLNGASLIGTKEKCLDFIEKLNDIGVNEIACLVDFGMSYKCVMEGLIRLTGIKEMIHLEKVQRYSDALQ